MAEQQQRDLDWRDGSLLVEEYKILSTHYFHEDIYYLRTVGLFGTFCAALLTLYGSNVIVSSEKLIRYAFLILGIVTSGAWGLGLIRIRYLRLRIESRIAELELAINNFWRSSDNPPPFALLNIRNRPDTAGLLQRLPVSILYQVFPLVFLVIFLSILLFAPPRDASKPVSRKISFMRCAPELTRCVFLSAGVRYIAGKGPASVRFLAWRGPSSATG